MKQVDWFERWNLVSVVDVRDLGLVASATDDDARRVDALDDAVALGDDAHAGVTRELAFHAGADERRLRADERHGLTLHVRAHERAVRVVVLEERNERRGDRHHLVRRDVHELDHVGRDHLEVAVETSARRGVSRNLPFSSTSAEAWAMYFALFFERRVPAAPRR